MKTAVFAYLQSLSQLEAFDSVEGAVAGCEGITVAEGDYLFFDATGQPLDAVFSTPVSFSRDGLTYNNGVYSLKNGSGKTLQEVLFELCRRKGWVNILTTEEMNHLYGID
ncbi:hypothetical protein ABI_05630 [Asticcacaulis biprosthecium C19]|uniref:Uncharacterized protein n=1 Tax=Asticcacaulis biprosthecium C19 TaxID=715226 RepID=F4QKH8_9CAUL|nr:hypothetical protein [Asticcacaulis biprosthecium]EGF92130.1 hypothetical protein ABI_05630 [Asticcacaulis biprosthecium C19]